MNKVIFKKIGMLSIFCIAVMTFALSLPLTCYAMSINFSPNIINIASERGGEIRVFTDMRYSTFVTDGDSVFIYFNGSDTVENIRATRDCWGNLILKFYLEDLLALENFLVADDFNDVEVVVVMNDGAEHSGSGEVYIVDKATKGQ
jgi:hypothetical protein